VTISHLRFSKKPIKSSTCLRRRTSWPPQALLHRPLRHPVAHLRGRHLPAQLEWKKEDVFNNLTPDLQKIIIEKKLKVYNIDAIKIAEAAGLAAASAR